MTHAVEPKVTLDLARGLGLTADEYDRIIKRLGREPSYTELGLFSALWSEHCAYKHSKVFLRRLPQTGRRVLQGPGENAGAIDIGDGWAVVFKIESHNHPSFIEPFQGAATGVGGILRDIFTMGARPIALLDSLRFGDPADPRTRRLIDGVVSGISWYGNCFGCPTVGGEIAFAPEYAGNPLVNVMCVGLVRADRIFRARAEGVGNPVFYVGNKTGRDGIHGATMASATFDEHAEERTADRAGRRSVHREAPAGGVSGGDGQRRGGRHPGHGRGGPGVLHLGDAGAQRDGDGRSSSRPCPSGKRG